MEPTALQRLFLASVHEFNLKFNAVRKGNSINRLYHSFWNEEDIAKSRSIQGEWEIPKSLVPFYGDWHTVICLDMRDGSVQQLDDERQISFSWPSIHEFESCLLLVPEKPTDLSGMIESESWIDD